MPRHYRLPDAVFDITICWFYRLARYKQRAPITNRCHIRDVVCTALGYPERPFKIGNAVTYLCSTNSVDEPQREANIFCRQKLIPFIGIYGGLKAEG
jgi:hypothetical protein